MILAIKRIVIIFCCIVFALSFVFISYADTIYGSVSHNTSQVQILYNYVRNLDEFDPLANYVIARTGEYQYTMYYNIDMDSLKCDYVRYYRGSNYDSNWLFSSGSNYDFNLNGDYALVGNLPGTISYSDNNTNIYQNVVIISVLFISILFLFFIFRVHKRGTINL